MIDFNLINSILGGVSAVVTIETRIREVISNRKEDSIKSLDEEFRECMKFDENTIGRIDDAISDFHLKYSDIGTNFIISENNRTQFIEDFFRNNDDLRIYKSDIVPAISNYFDLVEKEIKSVCSVGERVIIDKANEIQQSVLNIEKEVLEYTNENRKEKEEAEGKKLYTDNKSAKECVVYLNQIISLLRENANVCLRETPIPDNYLKGNDFDTVVIKLQKLFEKLNYKDIKSFVIKQENKDVSCFLEGIKYIVPDYASSINSKYEKKIKLIEIIIYQYDEKDREYYIALGALGLISDYSDEAIYRCIIETFEVYLRNVRDILFEKWKDRDSRLLENIAHEKMNEQLWNKIRFAISNQNKEWVKYLLISGDEITDVELAQKFDVNIEVLRNNLYNSTKSFLYYSYVDDYTTRLQVNGIYREVLEKYLRENNED